MRVGRRGAKYWQARGPSIPIPCLIRRRRCCLRTNGVVVRPESAGPCTSLTKVSLRSPVRAAWQAPRNLYLLGSVVLSAGIVLAVLYLPMLNEPLGTVPLGASQLGVVAALALVPFVCVEFGKALLRRSGWTFGVDLRPGF